METLFIYIAKSSGLIALFYFSYYFLLRKETFFNSNRWFLLTGLLTSALLPLYVYTKTVWIESTAVLNGSYSETVSIPVKESVEIDWNMILIALYAVGVLALILKFAFDYYNLNSILKGKKIKQQADFKFVDVNENIAPFSYFEYIVYNSSMFTPEELETIIEHEKVHSDQNHTVDVLISRAFCILFWFNPLIWFYKKAIVQNLEFIADKEAAKKLNDKKAYQYTLLKITTHDKCVAITNHFYQSLIKKRIIMLNKNQSSKRNSWKYYFVALALLIFVLLFQVQIIAKEKQPVLKEVSGKIKSVDVFKINKNSTDAELKTIKENLKKNHNIDANLSDVKRNTAGELTAIKIELTTAEELSKTYMASGSNAIKDCGIVVITGENGSKKINFNTENTEAKNVVAATDKKSKGKEKREETINTITNVNTDTNTNAEVSSTTNASTTVTVTSDATGKNKSNVVVMTNSQPKVRIADQLIIIDGEIAPGATIKDIENLNIKSMSVLNGQNAINEYGEQGKDGVIIIETKK
ncbi:M56 family metallopeptidase [Flavobacterium daemonense]|uniref:M56 family metallopeptidase n=1 Tax=Flavobacterium daemonense TaxID=1393049 RepID=UPI001185E3F8|nr:M56 family metallopeptidase [Flavobacterium daemonense]KAF2337243.1 M56 family peptidase [Flavobacterium daemonense]